MKSSKTQLPYFHKFRNAEVRRVGTQSKLSKLAYNLGVFLQGVDLPEEVADWSLTSIQSRLIKIGARVVRHARKITFQLAEVAVSGRLFGKIIAAIRDLKPPRGLHDGQSNETQTKAAP